MVQYDLGTAIAVPEGGTVVRPNGDRLRVAGLTYVLDLPGRYLIDGTPVDVGGGPAATVINNYGDLLRDTGWRNITNLLSASFVNSGNLLVRRVGAVVTWFYGDLVVDAARGAIPSLAVPAGFRTPGFAQSVNPIFAINGGPARVDAADGGALWQFYDLTTSMRLRDFRTTSTNDAWPAVLPGTPA